MNARKCLITSAIVAVMTAGAASHAGTINFSGYEWVVRPSGSGAPGPNHWDPNNVRVDENGWLHLRLMQRNGKWYCPEIHTQSPLGFGRYQFWLIGRVDKLDKNVVFGLYNYPTAEMGPDGTHEMDIEFARWGGASNPIGNYTVWPTAPKLSRGTYPFSFTLNGDHSTHRFTWGPTRVFFQSQHGHHDDDRDQFASWSYEPQKPATTISQKPMPVFINLWCFDGRAPSDGQEVELVVRAFKFTPM